MRSSRRSRRRSTAGTGIRAAVFPSPLVGEGGARSAPDEGFSQRIRFRVALAEATPHPSESVSSSGAALSHKKGRGRNDRQLANLESILHHPDRAAGGAGRERRIGLQRG